jgi:endoglucanase
MWNGPEYGSDDGWQEPRQIPMWFSTRRGVGAAIAGCVVLSLIASAALILGGAGRTTSHPRSHNAAALASQTSASAATATGDGHPSPTRGPTAVQTPTRSPSAAATPGPAATSTPTASSAPTPTPTSGPGPTPIPGSLAISVSGNHLVNGAGQTVVPRGVNRSGTEYACIQGWGIFDGPSDAASVQAIASWGAKIVRIPLNEDCWLNINGVSSAYAGTNYIDAIVSFVNLLHQNGMYAELSLIWGAPGSYQATYQPGAPDEDHSPAFWSSLAHTFKSDSAVILAPWGETIVDWNCFLNGGVCEATYGSNNTPYNTAGMQQAVTVMRQAGYNGVIAIPCIDYANDCTDAAPYFGGQGGGDWLSHEPSDPDHNLVAEAHIYGKNTCDTITCLDTTIGSQVGSVPFIFGETGETYDGSDCNNSSTYTSTIMTWADAHGVGYEAWTWDTWGTCSLSLITNYNGTPYGSYGTYVRQHLLAKAGG